MSVRCGGCGEPFELFVRNEYEWRRKGREPLCRRCRGISAVKPPTDAHRSYWLERFSLEEIREMASAIWPS